MNPTTALTSRLTDAYDQVRKELVAAQNANGHWVGRLSSSALAAATAVSAFSIVDEAQRQADGERPWRALIRRGRKWLVSEQNDDGGWGDTSASKSNLSTTMLALAAIKLSQNRDDGRDDGRDDSNSVAERGQRYVENAGGIPGLRARYGRDKTFAVPILTNAALAGQVSWDEVSPLPFELAALPQSFYRFARMPVVSYAIPALVAVGQAIHFHRPPSNRLIRELRRRTTEPTLRVLESMQPESGGYLEAIPLTSFVVMSLASTGRRQHHVVEEGLKFLADTARSDGSWPIDTNLATWVTSLAVNALPTASGWNEIQCWRWLLSCQHLNRHPFTGADPGGWGWSDLSGAVPDADDTPGALLALAKFCDQAEATAREDPQRESIDELCRATQTAAERGTRWLLNLQNGDGGWPTFCRGWGKLPFDRSGTDLTAHALRALLRWRVVCPLRDWQRATRRGWKYLELNQCPDGSWLPLWFGNQSHPDEANPVYGTARVLMACRDWDRIDSDCARRGIDFLIRQQDGGGGWGAGQESGGNSTNCSVEETSLAIESLLAVPRKIGGDSVTRARERGLAWLASAIETGAHREATPIGLYFAKLWYDESLYPLTFATSALREWDTRVKESY